LCSPASHFHVSKWSNVYQVNLLKSETPQDVYSCVAALVEQRRLTDAQNGVELARLCDGFVTRKVVKQTVMTIVYGVTSFGAKQQIEKQLRDLPAFPREHASQAARYLAALVFGSVGTLFQNTRKIQRWLDDVASLVSQKLHEPVQWTTPLEFPVVQPYFSRKVRFVPVPTNRALFPSTKNNDVIASTTRVRPSVTVVPDSRKQRSGFAPNFIHSLDSSHMMLTALHCQRLGLTYASVHDCFWTHAATVGTMNAVCREQFVALHREPILHNLSQHLLHNVVVPKGRDDHSVVVTDREKTTKAGCTNVYNEMAAQIGKVLQSVPIKGSLKLEEVLESAYFFS